MFPEQPSLRLLVVLVHEKKKFHAVYDFGKEQR